MSAIQFNTKQFDNKHLRSLAMRRKRLQALYDAFYKQVAVIGTTTGFNDPDKEFYLRDYPAAQQAIYALLQQLSRDITTNIKDGNAAAWSASNAKNSALIAALGVQKATADTLLARITKRSESAFNAFQKRKVDGLGLSERVWALNKGVMPQIEMALELGLAQGKSAAALSRDVRSYLNEPNRLFRRVRGKDGILRLSKAARAYHPGQGVYRSSYKNALRMTVTENNMAYRSADHAQWGEMNFVIGIEISLSGNHPVVDICDELKGKYPKEFKFTGWHPFCRCFATPILPSREEMNKWARMSDAERAGYHFNGEVDKMPKQFNKWLDDNAERISRAKSMPYFIKDNFDTDILLNANKAGAGAVSLSYARAEMRREIEDKCKLVKGTPMSDLEADRQSANPHVLNGIEYQENCSATSAAFILRKWGYDVEANAWQKGNRIDDFLEGKSPWYELWKNPDGSQPRITSSYIWLRGKGKTAFTPRDYLDFFEEACKDEGYYVTSIGWENGQSLDCKGHLTILKKEKNRLFRIEPQWDNSNGAPYENLDIFELCFRGHKTPHLTRGVLRVDDLVFDTSGRNLEMFRNKIK